MVNQFNSIDKKSGGERQSYLLARAFDSNAEILLLDEPMAALDLVCKRVISAYIKVHKENGGIVLMATHDNLELELCDRWYIIKNGVLTPFDYTGDLNELVKRL